MSRAAGPVWGHNVTPHHIARLRAILESHRGAGRYIRARDLAVALGIKDPTGRTIRELANALIGEGCPVGSINLREGGGGYFIISTPVELERCAASYRSRANEILKKAERLREAFLRGVAQTTLFAEPATAGGRLRGTETGA